VDDPAAVRELETLANLNEDRDHRTEIAKGPVLEELVEVVPGQVFLDDVGHVVLKSEVEDQGDVRVDQVPDELGFLVEALPDLGVGRAAHLDGDGPLDEGVPPLVDDAEPAHPDLLEDLVLADLPWLIHAAPIVPHSFADTKGVCSAKPEGAPCGAG